VTTAPTLSVVIPVYNERGTVEELLRRIAQVTIPKEIVLVDDASTDGTGERLDALVRRFESEGGAALGLTDADSAAAAPLALRLHRQSPNQGKGAAVRAGFARTMGDIVIVQDADLEYDPSDYPALIAPILEGRADVVYGSRLLGGDLRRGYRGNYWANRFLTFVSNRFTGLGLTDMETCYKVMRGEIARGLRLRSDRFGFDPEITAKIARGGHRVVEVPVAYRGRSYAEGKKIRWMDGFVVLRAILRYARRD
jgi:glycosyltransferase involved in cell wall biosynthesis